MANLVFDLTGIRPKFVSAGHAPTGAYAFTIDSAELRQNEGNEGMNIDVMLALTDGSNPDGVGTSQRVIVFAPNAVRPPKPGPNADKQEKDAHRMDADNRAKFLAFLVAINFPLDKLTATPGVKLDIENKLPGRSGHIYLEPAPDRDSRAKQEWMTPEQYASYVSGKFKIAPRQPKPVGSDARRGGKSSEGAAADIADDLDELDAKADTKVDTKAAGKTAGKAPEKEATNGVKPTGKGAGAAAGNLDDLEM